MTEGVEQVGYGNPPRSTRFKHGQSGNPRGRPRNKRREIPYDHILGQMVTIREDGRERRVTAAEAFLLQLTKKGLEGCSASARASLAAIENARSTRTIGAESIQIIRIVFRSFGLCCVIEDLGMGIRLNAASKENARLELKPWIVRAALARMKTNQLSAEQQAMVYASTRTPDKVVWPDWWVIRS
jgi:hypothetical protein